VDTATDQAAPGSIDAALSKFFASEEPETTETEAETVAEEEDQSTEEVGDDEPEDADGDGSEEDAEGQDAEDDGEEYDESQLVTVKIDGKTQQVTLRELKRGYSGQQYVQQGMQQAAQARKQAEEVYSALLQERQQVAAILQQAQAGGIPQPPKEPPKELFTSDPIGYMEQKLRFDDDLKQYQASMGQYQQVLQQQTAAEQRAMETYLLQEQQQLLAVEPELADPEVASKWKDRLLTRAPEIYGYTAEEISGVMDHRALRVLADALRYRDLQAGKAGAQKKAEDAAKQQRGKVLKPGAKRATSAPKQKAFKQQKSRLKRSGRIEDAVGLLLDA
jgi:hypothetical protein